MRRCLAASIVALYAAGCATGTPPMMVPRRRPRRGLAPGRRGPVARRRGHRRGHRRRRSGRTAAAPTRAPDAGAPTDGGGTDAGTDAGGGGTGTCPSFDVGHTPVLDGSGDLAEYPTTQRLVPGGMVGSSDELALTWDRDYLYATLSSPVFADEFRPVHLYPRGAPPRSPPPRRRWARSTTR